jgi:hypothetical protein
MLSFSISYPDLITFRYLWIPLKEGIGGETEVDFTDNSNVQTKKEWVHPPLSTHVWAFTSVYYIPHRVLSGFSASPLMFMKIGQVQVERELKCHQTGPINNCALCRLLYYVQICKFK